MDLLGIIWDLCLEPVLHWLAKKWVRFVVRKQAIWEPGIPFPRYFGQIRQAIIYAPAKPWRLYRALLPMPRLGRSWDQMVFSWYQR